MVKEANPNSKTWLYRESLSDHLTASDNPMQIWWSGKKSKDRSCPLYNPYRTVSHFSDSNPSRPQVSFLPLTLKDRKPIYCQGFCSKRHLLSTSRDQHCKLTAPPKTGSPKLFVCMCGWVSEKGGRGEESQGQVAPGEQAQLEPRVNPWGGKTQIVLSVSFFSKSL